MKDNIETIRSPDFAHRESQSPILRKLMGITSQKFIKYEKGERIHVIFIMISILLIGTIFCAVNGFFTFLLYFIELDQNDLESNLRLLMGLSYSINFLIFFTLIEGISRLIYKNSNNNTLNFFISFGIIQFPMIFYLVLHFIFKILDLLGNSIFNFIDKIFLIIFQVWVLWLLSYNLCVNKGLKIESSLIISLILHYGGFTLVLFLMI